MATSSTSAFSLAATATSVAFSSIAFIGIVSPASAQGYTVWLKDNERITVTGYFIQGESIHASCDQDRTNLDLYLYNEMGVLVDADEAISATPELTAPYEGTFSVQIIMPSCTHSAGCSAAISSDYGF